MISIYKLSEDRVKKLSRCKNPLYFHSNTSTSTTSTTDVVLRHIWCVYISDIRLIKYISLNVYTVHCTLYTVHCTLYIVQCTVYTIFYSLEWVTGCHIYKKNLTCLQNMSIFMTHCVRNAYIYMHIYININ